MEGEKKTARGAKLQLNRRAGLASEAVEMGFPVRSQSPHATATAWKTCEFHACATREINMYDLRITRDT